MFLDQMYRDWCNFRKHMTSHKLGIYFDDYHKELGFFDWHNLKFQVIKKGELFSVSTNKPILVNKYHSLKYGVMGGIAGGGVGSLLGNMYGQKHPEKVQYLDKPALKFAVDRNNNLYFFTKVIFNTRYRYPSIMGNLAEKEIQKLLEHIKSYYE